MGHLSLYAINARNVLVADFIEKKKAAALFPPFFTLTITANTIKHFQLNINIVIGDTNDVCTYCGLFILFGTSIFLTRVYPEFVSVIKTALIVNDDLNCYGCTNNNFHF